jgi:hypothetical protein
MSASPWLNLAVALALGLLIGLERERSKGDGAERRPAGADGQSGDEDRDRERRWAAGVRTSVPPGNADYARPHLGRRAAAHMAGLTASRTSSHDYIAGANCLLHVQFHFICSMADLEGSQSVNQLITLT